jgi:hypothetical protein
VQYELERMWVVAVVVSFKIPCKQLSSDNDKRHRMFGGCVRFVAVTTLKIGFRILDYDAAKYSM